MVAYICHFIIKSFHEKFSGFMIYIWYHKNQWFISGKYHYRKICMFLTYLCHHIPVNISVYCKCYTSFKAYCHHEFSSKPVQREVGKCQTYVAAVYSTTTPTILLILLSEIMRLLCSLSLSQHQCQSHI